MISFAVLEGTPWFVFNPYYTIIIRLLFNSGLLLMLQAQSLRLQFVAAILKEGSAAHTPTEGTGAGSARCQSYGSPWSFLGGSSGASRG